jgi:hypothetical protein
LYNTLLTSPSPFLWVPPAGNLLTDASIQDLVDILLSTPNAMDITYLDLSHNALLTWRCCQYLAPLLLTAPPEAPAAEEGEGEGHRESMGGLARHGSGIPAAGGLMPTLTLDAGTLAQLAGAARDLNPHRLGAAGQQQRNDNGLSTLGVNPADLPPLAVLSLKGVQLGDRGVAALCEALPYNNTLRELHLSKCQLKGVGVVTLACALICNKSLELLDLSWNSMSHAGASALAAALR